MALGSWLLNGTMTPIVGVTPYHIARVIAGVLFIKFYDAVFFGVGRLYISMH